MSEQAIRAELADLVEPLRQQLEDLRVEIAAREAELAALRIVKGRATRALELLAPGEPKIKITKVTKAKGDGPAKSFDVAEPTLEKIRVWLTDRSELLNEQGFSTRDLLADYGFDLTSDSTLAKALAELYRRGALRLDRKGEGKKSRARYYKVI